MRYRASRLLIATTLASSLFFSNHQPGLASHGISFELRSDANCYPTTCNFSPHNTSAPLLVQPGDSVQYDIHLDLTAIPPSTTLDNPYISANLPQAYALGSCESSLGVSCKNTASQVFWDGLPQLDGGQIYDFYFNVGIPNDQSLCNSGVWLTSTGFFTSSFVNLQTKAENGGVQCSSSIGASANPNPGTDGQLVTLSALITWMGKPVDIGKVNFATPDPSSSSGYRELGNSGVDSSGIASVGNTFEQGTYEIDVTFSAPGSGYSDSQTSFGLDVGPGSGPTPSPSTSPSPSPGISPTPPPQPTPQSSHQPNDEPSPGPTAELPTTGPESTPPPVADGNALELAPPRPLPELHVLNAGTVLALQALDLGPAIGLLDFLAVMGLAWHIRRRVTAVDDD